MIFITNNRFQKKQTIKASYLLRRWLMMFRRLPTPEAGWRFPTRWAFKVPHQGPREPDTRSSLTCATRLKTSGHSRTCSPTQLLPPSQTWCSPRRPPPMIPRSVHGNDQRMSPVLSLSLSLSIMLHLLPLRNQWSWLLPVNHLKPNRNSDIITIKKWRFFSFKIQKWSCCHVLFESIK